MSDATTAINRIADILEKTSEVPFLQTDAGRFAILVLGAILGALFTYVVLRHLRRQEIERMEREQLQRRHRERRLLVALLGDEIALRWNQLIGKDLRRELGQFTDDSVDAMCRRTTFRPEDLHVFQQCANDISFATALEDPAVVSHVIYVHILVRDFLDCQNHLRQRFKEYEEAPKDDSPPDISTESRSQGNPSVGREAAKEELRTVWEDLRSIYRKIDTQMIRIYARIETEYERFIELSEFIREQDIVEDEIRNRLDEVASKRLPKARQ